MKDLIKTVIFDQQRMVWNKNFIPRCFSENILTSEMIVVISGIRRCGKSTLLSQIRNENREKDYYMNCDDERLIRFSVDHFQLLHETFIEFLSYRKNLQCGTLLYPISAIPSPKCFRPAECFQYHRFQGDLCLFL